MPLVRRSGGCEELVADRVAPDTARRRVCRKQHESMRFLVGHDDASVVGLCASIEKILQSTRQVIPRKPVTFECLEAPSHNRPLVLKEICVNTVSYAF